MARPGLFPRLLLLAALLLSTSAARADEAPPKTGFQLLSPPDGADVSLDDRPVGRTPLGGPIAAAPGEHRVRVSRLGFSPYTESFRVYPGRIASLLVEMAPVAGVLQLRASAPGARVFIDGRYAGDAPLELELPTGPHNVRVSRAGFRDEIFNVGAVPGMLIEREAQLVELSAHATFQEQVRSGPSRLSSRWWIWPLSIIGAAGVAAAVIVPTVYASRSPCQRVDVEVCTPIQVMVGSTTPTLSVRLPF